MTATEFAIAAFLTYRISRIIANQSEEGPFAIFSWIRLKLAINKQDTWWRRGLACSMCVSVWVGIFVAALFFGITWQAIYVGLALSAVTVVLTAIAG